MAIDLSVLLGTNSGTASTGTISPMAMYKKLQRLAEENKQKYEASAEEDKAKAQVREFNNAAIRLRNNQYKLENARVEGDAIYFQNRAATATTVDELINDDRFLKVIAYGNGLGDLYEFNRQRLRDILTSDLNDPNSVARLGTTKELELAMRYNMGATGSQFDINGNVVGLDVNGNLVNDGSHVTELPAGLAKLRGLNLDLNGKAEVRANGSLLISSNTVVSQDAGRFTTAQKKTLLREETAPPKPSYYEFEGTEFDNFRASRKIQAEVEYYKENIGNIQSLDDLFQDYRLLKFVLASYDMESEVQYPGKIRKIIESDMADPDSLANRFQDPRFQKLATDIAFNHVGVDKLKLKSTTDDMVKRYEQVAYERHLDEQAPGVRAALEFSRRLPSVSKTTQVLGDAVLREVVTVANQLPKEMAYQEVDAQITAVEKRFDVQAVKNDKAEIEKLVVRYLTFKESGTTGGPQSYLLNLFG